MNNTTIIHDGVTVEDRMRLYRDGLLEDTYRFWFPRCLDRKHGGYYSAFDRRGELIDTDKSVWAQGRIAWMLGTLYNFIEPREEFLTQAQAGIEFIDRHCFDGDGRMFFTVTHDGRPLRKRRYAYSESFAAIAHAAYARATGDARSAQRARDLFELYLRWNFTPGLMPPKHTGTRPATGIGPRMIAIVTAQELRLNLGDSSFDGEIDRNIGDIERLFVKDDLRVVLETAAPDGEIIDHFDGRTLNPGHAIEAAWFIMHEGKIRGIRHYIDLGLRILDYMWERGWDEEHGGIFYFRDLHGHPVQEYWHDMKFWWPHNEAIIATLLAWTLTRDAKYARWYQKIHDWSFRHFPDAQCGEWFGYLHRDGRISTDLKGNMWKSFFHLPRMQFYCARLLGNCSPSPPPPLPTMTKYLRHSGKRWALLYGGDTGIDRFTVTELQRAAQNFFPYVIETRHASDADAELLQTHHVLLCGTKDNNHLISRLSDDHLISIPAHDEGYCMASSDSPWSKESKMVVLAGHDENGALYAVEDFNARILAARLMPDIPALRRAAFDDMPPFNFSEHPAVANRGIWTWGYVIYGYKKFFDNMARLRLNTATIWNDHAPVNCREVIEHAHARGIKIVLGFSWGWSVPGSDGMDISSASVREEIKRRVLAEYQNCRHLPLDGLYLQTDTEHATVLKNGQSMAHWACLLVNETATDLFAINPRLEIQFGLHATCIQNDYHELLSLDPRITLVWEDAGVIPYAYEPIVSWTERETEPADKNVANWLESAVGTPEATLAYSKKLATFRPSASGFAMVPKGWTTLRWPQEFENHGSFILGERSETFIRARLQERKPRWDRINQLWLRRFALARTFYSEMLAVQPKMTVTALIEDGLFEAGIQPSVSLFAQTLWNPKRPPDEILSHALSPYYSAE